MNTTRPGVLGCWEITIPHWRPAALNELMRGRWQAARLKARDRDVVAYWTWGRAIPRVTGKRRVSLRIMIPKRQRRWDIDAFQKSLLDALVHARVIIDDHPDDCEWGGVEYTRGDRLQTTIIVEELEG